MKNFLLSLLVSCSCLGIVALILVFSFGREILAAYENKDWLGLGIFAFFAIELFVLSKLSDKKRKK